jgi:hypothetical protein
MLFTSGKFLEVAPFQYTPPRTHFISGLEFFIAAAQCKNIGPERLNWPGRLAGISEGAHSIST